MIEPMNFHDKERFCELLSVHRTSHFRGIKKTSPDVGITAMVGFDNWAPNSVFIHVWILGPKYLSRSFIRECLSYAFETCGVGIVIGVTPCNNAAALELNRRIGFNLLLTVKDGYALGIDTAVQELRKEDCRWLTKVPNGQELSTSRT